MAKINDFGQKIGGARKDLWKVNGLTIEDLTNLNEAEKKKFVCKNNIWILPDAKKQVYEEKIPAFVAFWQRKIRRMVFPSPYISRELTLEETIEQYILEMRLFKEKVMQVKSMEDIKLFYVKFQLYKYIDFRYQNIIDLYDLRRSQYKLSKWQRECEYNRFPETRDKKTKSNRKKAFIPPQLLSIEREGKNYRHGMNVDSYMWQNEFDFRGVEFGNWMSQKDRQCSMNYAFDALKDLAYALEIDEKSIAFNGQLSLAFGARGCSRASAHYEPLREVINLTKMHGAGCTAHEWFHALDDRLAKYVGVTDGKMASETKDKDQLPMTFLTLLKAIKFDEDGTTTDFYKGSREFDGHFAKDAHGYWSSSTEMLARAFACYVKDTLGCKSDYLIAHADTYEFEFDNQSICAIPQGDERELLNELFDQLFFELKKMGFLKENTHYDEASSIVMNSHHNIKACCKIPLQEDCNGQMSFC